MQFPFLARFAFVAFIVFDKRMKFKKKISISCIIAMIDNLIISLTIKTNFALMIIVFAVAQKEPSCIPEMGFLTPRNICLVFCSVS